MAFEAPQRSLTTLNTIYHRLDSTNTPFTAQVGFPDGTKTLPAMYFADDTDNGIYRLANETTGISVAGTAFVRIQGGPNRFLIGTDCDAITPQTTFHVEDPDAGINLIRSIAAEAFISTQNVGGGGGQQRGLVSGGLRWVDTNLTELMRMTNGTDAALGIKTTTPLAHLHVQQPAGSSLDTARFRTNGGLNCTVEAGGNILAGVNDAGVVTGAGGQLHIGGGNSGIANTTASLALGLVTTGVVANMISSHHAAGNPVLCGMRFWTSDGTTDSVFPTNHNIGLSMFNGRVAVGIESPDAVFSVTGSVDPLADLNDPTDYQYYIHNKQDNNGEGAGIAFSVDASDGFVGASIIHERVNNGSYGSLNFYTQQTIASNPDPVLVLKLTEGGVTNILGDLDHDGTNVGFYGTAPAAKPTVTGAKGGNAALTNLLTALANLGLITDSTT